MDSSVSSLSHLYSSSELKGSKLFEEGDESGSAFEDDHPSMSQVKPPTSSQEQNRHFAKLLTRSMSKEDLKEGPP
jgi:hypothetical protein